MERLSAHFEGIAWKYLTAVDAELFRSNQHELGGLKAAGFSRYLGEPSVETLHFPATFIYLTDDEDQTLQSEGLVSWYDARRGVAHRSSEYRLYYQSNPVTDRMAEGDFCLLAKKQLGDLLFIATPAESTSERQLRWLFEIDLVYPRFIGRELEDSLEKSSAVAGMLLESVGIQNDPTNDEADLLCRILERFGSQFPGTRQFSAFARELSRRECAADEPDSTLMEWIETEERLFRVFERHQVQARLDQGIREVDEFISYSLSVQNRRKSRAGHSLENHVEKLLHDCGLKFERGARTEHRSTPDFLFPGGFEYQNPAYSESALAMLGAKSSCKERWRQVLAEAARIHRKHLLTLEPGLSDHQTDEMERQQLQLVVPRLLHDSYSNAQKRWLWDVRDFVRFIHTLQK